MTKSLASAEWNRAVAAIIKARSAGATADALIAAIGTVVNHNGTALLAFHDDAPPEVMHHSLEPKGAIHYLDRYIAGPYLLDPLYQLARRKNVPGVCRYRDATPDRFRSSEYYHQYCERTHLTDEMDFLVAADSHTTLALVVGRRSNRFSKRELQSLSQIEAVVHAAMLTTWEHFQGSAPNKGRDEAVHRRLNECFENFGKPHLTVREREISQFLLRGFSSKAIARRLRIAPARSWSTSATCSLNSAYRPNTRCSQCSSSPWQRTSADVYP